MRWSPEPRPRAQDTCVVTVPIHLRQEYEIGTASFGHLLRDNYTPLVTIASQFGFSAAAFSWVSWPRATGRRKDTLAHVQEKYNGWISAHRAYKWGGFTAACMAGQLGGGVRCLLRVVTTRGSFRYAQLQPAFVAAQCDIHSFKPHEYVTQSATVDAASFERPFATVRTRTATPTNELQQQPTARATVQVPRALCLAASHGATCTSSLRSPVEQAMCPGFATAC